MQFIAASLKPLLVAGLIVAVVVVGLNAPQPTAPAPLATAPAQDTWQLPELPDNNSKKAIETITARDLWGSVRAAANGPLAKPIWRYAGVIRQGKERYVLINIDGKPVSILKEGDELPDNAKIVKIEDDRFFVLIDGQQRVFGSYTQ